MKLTNKFKVDVFLFLLNRICAIIGSNSWMVWINMLACVLTGTSIYIQYVNETHLKGS